MRLLLRDWLFCRRGGGGSRGGVRPERGVVGWVVGVTVVVGWVVGIGEMGAGVWEIVVVVGEMGVGVEVEVEMEVVVVVEEGEVGRFG